MRLAEELQDWIDALQGFVINDFGSPLEADQYGYRRTEDILADVGRLEKRWETLKALLIVARGAKPVSGVAEIGILDIMAQLEQAGAQDA